jgi:hypothetical protein
LEGVLSAVDPAVRVLSAVDPAVRVLSAVDPAVRVLVVADPAVRAFVVADPVVAPTLAVGWAPPSRRVVVVVAGPEFRPNHR